MPFFYPENDEMDILRRIEYMGKLDISKEAHKDIIEHLNNDYEDLMQILENIQALLTLNFR